MERLEKIIYEINGNDTFVKVKNNSFGIEKAIFSFVKYDNKTNKAINNGDFYLDFAGCLKLYRDIDKGLLQRDIKTELERSRQENQKYAKPVRQFQGGVPEEKANRSDKCALARILSIEPGMNKPDVYPYILKYQEGPAKTNPQNKLITPLWWSDRNYKADFQIVVPCTEADMTKLALLLFSHINAFLSSCYVRGVYIVDREKNGQKNSMNQNQEPKQAFAQQTSKQQTSMPQQSQQPVTSHAKPHQTTVTPVAGKKAAENKENAAAENEGITTDVRQMEVTFLEMPEAIVNSEIHHCVVLVKGKKLTLYFTPDVYKANKEMLIEACKKEKVAIRYVIVKDKNFINDAYTYFVAFS